MDSAREKAIDTIRKQGGIIRTREAFRQGIHQTDGIREALQGGKARHPLTGGHGSMNADPVKNVTAAVFNNEKIKE